MLKNYLPIIILLLIGPTLVLFYNFFFKIIPRLINEYKYSQKLKILGEKISKIDLVGVERKFNIVIKYNDEITNLLSEKYGFINYKESQEFINNFLYKNNILTKFLKKKKINKNYKRNWYNKK